MLKINILAENHTTRKDIPAEHGLSVLFNAGEELILES